MYFSTQISICTGRRIRTFKKQILNLPRIPFRHSCIRSEKQDSNLRPSRQNRDKQPPSQNIFWVFSGIEPCSSNSQFDILPNKLKTPFCGLYENRTRGSRETVEKVTITPISLVPF